MSSIMAQMLINKLTVLLKCLKKTTIGLTLTYRDPVLEIVAHIVLRNQSN